MSRRVYVAGLGAVTPLGANWPETLCRLMCGEAAIAPITRFDVAEFPCQVAACIDEPSSGDRRVFLAARAAEEAWLTAQLSPAPERLGVFIGAESQRVSFATAVGLMKMA